ncbi:uncharacterized protein EV420DRAFT_1564641 [Desarmillaria tabescens]|uniref:Uncharacterized protein n=1 Tax=Armillaria tabescens TaxID=1929756 RepID=A0AA39MXC8_ARMTA|nr:uncharacterized protein EV420DRAFT_1564641 [Desarmillaria tabescens]KAK0449554.1 hypothetical protein EV420DRAFT_1564641 [Desarmillaria tabescens]
MFSKAVKSLQFVFYSALTSVAPFDFHTIPPKNTLIFEPNAITRKDRKSQTARYYLSSVAQHCPHGAGEAVVKKMELMKSSWIPNHEFLLFYVKDRRNIYGREAVIRVEILNDSSPPQPESDTTTPSLQPAQGDGRPFPSESTPHAVSHSSSSPPTLRPALDLFTITCMPVISTKDCNILSTLTFNGNSTFSIEEVAAIASVASAAADEQSLLGHQSSWYARMIYSIILETQAGNYTKAPPDKHMGKHKIVDDAASNILIPSSDASKQLTQAYLKRWREYLGDIDDRKKVKEEPSIPMAEAPRREAEADRRETERLRQESLELQLMIAREKEETRRLRKEIEDSERELALCRERSSSSRPSAI